MLSFEPAWGGREEALIPSDVGTGQFLKAGLTIIIGHFSYFHLFSPQQAQGPWEGDAKEESQGSGKWQGERPLLPGVSLRASLLFSVLENQQPQISMLMPY